MAFAEHLGNLGAKHIVLTSKRGVRSGGQQAALQKLFSKNINVCPAPAAQPARQSRCAGGLLLQSMASLGLFLPITLCNPECESLIWPERNWHCSAANFSSTVSSAHGSDPVG